MIGDSGRDLIIQYRAENLHRLAEPDQRKRLFELGDAEPGGARAVKTFGDFLHTEPVGVRLQHGENFQRLHRLLNVFEIPFDRIQINFQPDPAVRGNFRCAHSEPLLPF